jgi:hypothetical protein
MINYQVTVAFLEGLKKTTKIIGELVQLCPFRMQLGPVTVCGNLIDNLHEKGKTVACLMPGQNYISDKTWLLR